MKYMGSKSRVSKYIVPIIQQYIDCNEISNYYEPFCGGCNIIDKVKCENKIASDYNKYLISLLQRVQNGECLYEECPRTLYEEVRKSYNLQDGKFEDWEYGNIGFLASYNGRFFDGGYAKSGYEKTKNGLRFRDYYQESLNNLLNQSKSLEEIDFHFCSYIEISPKNSMIYCDPPYKNTKQYNISKDFDYELFWNTMREWSKENIVLISEQDAPEDFKCIWQYPVSRSIKSTDKSTSVEKLFIIREVEK